MEPTRWTILVSGGVEPILHGPYRDDEHRDQELKTLGFREISDSVFALNIDENGNPELSAWSGRELEALLEP